MKPLKGRNKNAGIKLDVGFDLQKMYDDALVARHAIESTLISLAESGKICTHPEEFWSTSKDPDDITITVCTKCGRVLFEGGEDTHGGE